MSSHMHLLGYQILVLLSLTNSPNKTLPQWRMPTESCSCISHIHTWLLQLHSDQAPRHHHQAPRHHHPRHHHQDTTIRHHHQDTTTTRHHHQAPRHLCTTILHNAARLIKILKPRDHITLAFQQLHWLSMNYIQNLCPNVQHPFWVNSALHVILGHTVHKSRIKIDNIGHSIRLPGFEFESRTLFYEALALGLSKAISLQGSTFSITAIHFIIIIIVCSGSIVVTTLDCGPIGSWFKSRVGANILWGSIDCTGLIRAFIPSG